MRLKELDSDRQHKAEDKKENVEMNDVGVKDN